MYMTRGIIAVSVLIVAALGYPNGAPEPACKDLAPIHAGTTPQTSPSPYSIDYDAANWKSDGSLKVRITGPAFNGFILQARKRDNSGIGMFDASNLPSGTQAGPCMLGGNKISVTHSDPSPKSNLTFTWKAPYAFNGDMYFQGAVAINHSTYWVNIKSANVGLTEGSTTPDNAAQTMCFSLAPLLMCLLAYHLFKSY